MTRIYLIRHAEAEGNLYRIAHGHEEGLITDYRGPRQIRALAQRFRDIPVDAVYASDLIRQVTGKNFTALVLEEQMKESEKLLKTSNVPISKVALLSGYQEPSYFMKVFKKYFGCTPSQYRENISLK